MKTIEILITCVVLSLSLFVIESSSEIAAHEVDDIDYDHPLAGDAAKLLKFRQRFIERNSHRQGVNDDDDEEMDHVMDEARKYFDSHDSLHGGQFKSHVHVFGDYEI